MAKAHMALARRAKKKIMFFNKQCKISKIYEFLALKILPVKFS